MYTAQDSKYNYIGNQLLKAMPLPVLDGDNGQIRMKIHSERGESNWLNITPQQMKQIENILFELEE